MVRHVGIEDLEWPGGGRFYMTVLAVLILLNQPDPDLREVSADSEKAA